MIWKMQVAIVIVLGMSKADIVSICSIRIVYGSDGSYWLRLRVGRWSTSGTMESTTNSSRWLCIDFLIGLGAKKNEYIRYHCMAIGWNHIHTHLSSRTHDDVAVGCVCACKKKIRQQIWMQSGEAKWNEIEWYFANISERRQKWVFFSFAAAVHPNRISEWQQMWWRKWQVSQYTSNRMQSLYSNARAEKCIRRHELELEALFGFRHFIWWCYCYWCYSFLIFVPCMIPKGESKTNNSYIPIRFASSLDDWR